MYNIKLIDYFWLLRRIRIRRIDDYFEKLEISLAVNMDKEVFEKTIDPYQKTRKYMLGIEDAPVEIDRESIDAFKRKFQNQSRMIKFGPSK